MAKILSVDDSESCRSHIKSILAGSYEILEAADGKEALSVLSQHSDIDLVVCDVNMPNMDGITFCKKKFEIESIKSIPVVMVTTESSLEVKKELKNFGVKAWVLKPIDEASFKKGVQLLLQSKTGN